MATNVLTWIDEVAVPPAVGAVQEFQQSGPCRRNWLTAGGVVNLVTKSGSNAFRRPAVLRSDKLTPTNSFASPEQPRYNSLADRSAARAKETRPSSSTTNSIASAESQIATVPVAEERKGDFSNTRDVKGTLIPVYDPATTRQPAGTGAGPVPEQCHPPIPPRPWHAS
jgi:hypothetical protein